MRPSTLMRASERIIGNLEVENRIARRSYNEPAGRNGSGHCGDAAMPRDNPEGSSSRCSAAREVLLSRCRLTGGSHRTIDPHALKIPARRAEYSLTENVTSPFQAEPRQQSPVAETSDKVQMLRPTRARQVTERIAPKLFHTPFVTSALVFHSQSPQSSRRPYPSRSARWSGPKSFVSRILVSNLFKRRILPGFSR